MKFDKKKFGDTLIGGLIKNNPTFVLVLGTCPTIAMTTTLFQAFAMGMATTFVLIFSNLFISLLRKAIPDKVRIPCYIVIISTFVIIVQMVMQKFMPDLYSTMRAFIALIVVNCIILARAESYASCNKPFYSMVDGLSVGIGFTAALCLIGIVREFLSSGSFAGFAIPGFPAMSGAGASAFGFIVFGCLMALFNFLVEKVKKRSAGKRAEKERKADSAGAAPEEGKENAAPAALPGNGKEAKS